MDTTTNLRIRALAPGEHGPVRAVFDGMSQRSRHQRFHGPTPKLTSSMERLLTDVGSRRHVALVAEVSTSQGWRPVGTARLVATGETVAEVAFEVVDEWHGRGVGRRLLTALRRRAVDLGYTSLVALVLPGNRAAAALVRSVFDTVTVRRVGVVAELAAHVAPRVLDVPHHPDAAETALAA